MVLTRRRLADALLDPVATAKTYQAGISGRFVT
jgi:hypothetical protein